MPRSALLLVPAEFLPASHGRDPGELIMSRAAERDADLLAMGSYGHTRPQEIALGGMTRTILSSMNLPVLMSR